MNKGPLALRTISETAEALGVQQHVLRFWETKFTFIRPTKRAGGRRFYRPQDIDLLRGVKTLLYDKGYTIRGVQKLFKEGGAKSLLTFQAHESMSMEAGRATQSSPADFDVSEQDPEGEEAELGFQNYSEANPGNATEDFGDQPPTDSQSRSPGTLPGLTPSLRQAFLKVALGLEEAQSRLGRQIGRTGRG